MPPEWTNLEVGYNHRATGVPGVLLLPAAELQRIHRKSGSYVLASPKGMLDDQAVRLRLRAAPVTLAVLHTSDFDAMHVGTANDPTENMLRVRALKARERAGLLEPSVWLLVILAVVAAGLALAAALFPVDTSAQADSRLARAVAGESSALATLESEPGTVLSTTGTGSRVQRALTSSAHIRLDRAALVVADHRLAEDLEHAVAAIQQGQGRTQQAADDVRTWAAQIAKAGSKPSSTLRDGLDSASKVVAGIAGLIAALIAFRRALPGAPLP